MNILLYLMKVNLGLMAFYAFYWVFLRKNTFFQTNRLYLLMSVVVSFLLPLIKVKHNYTFEQPLPPTLNELPSESIKTVVYHPVIESVSAFSFNWIDLFSVIYLVGVAVFSIRFIVALIKIYALLRKGEPIDVAETRTGKNYWLLRTNERFSSYSFFNFLILNKEDIVYNRHIITDHEEIHISQGHSWDILLIELVHIFCWFNPLLNFYKDSLRSLHEFIADSIVEASESVAYAEFLFAYNFRLNASNLSHDFFRDSLLKERIMMMMKKRSPKWVLGKYIFVLPLVVFLGYFVAAQDIRKAIIANTNIRNKEIQADFKGGEGLLGAYFYENLQYPEKARRNGIEGNVYASFTVRENGSIGSVNIIRSLEPECDQEVKRLLKNMPIWNPQISVEGVPMMSRQYISVRFSEKKELKYHFYGRSDPRFRGILLINGEVEDYGDEIYPDSKDLVLENNELSIEWMSRQSTFQNRQILEKYTYIYGDKVRNGLMVFYSKKPLEVPNNEKFTNPTALTYSEYLTPEEGLKKYGEKGKNGVIIETLIK